MSMKEKKSQIVLILAFIAMITLPQAMFWVMNKEVLEVSTTENRKLNQKPKFKLDTITEYPKEFEDYYNDHLPFRAEIREFWTNLNYDVFKTVDSNAKMLLGKKGWMFYRGDTSIEQVQGLAKFSNIEKERIMNNLQEDIDKLKANNIETYILILPNKENVYKEYLPDSIPINTSVSRTEELIEYIQKNSNIKIVYPKEKLLQAKEKEQIYRKYDTHWNELGAFIGTIELQKQIDPNFEYDVKNITIEGTNERAESDLSKLIGMNNRVYENKTKINGFLPEIEYIRNETEEYEEYVSNSKNDKTVVFIGDSFRINMKEYFSKLYKRVVYVKNNYKTKTIEQIKPDIVVIESVERFSSDIDKKIRLEK